jgi:hypothetical protein
VATNAERVAAPQRAGATRATTLGLFSAEATDNTPLDAASHAQRGHEADVMPRSASHAASEHSMAFRLKVDGIVSPFRLAM